MKRALALAAFLALIAGPASQGQILGYTPLGCGQLASISSATKLNTVVVNGVTGIPTGARLVDVYVSATIRYRDDGVAPTASVGPEIQATQWWPYSGNLNNIQFIPVTGNATIDLCFYQ